MIPGRVTLTRRGLGPRIRRRIGRRSGSGHRYDRGVEWPGATSIELEGRIVPYLLRPNRRSRGLRMTIDPRQGLVVSTPWPGRRGWPAGALLPRAEAFLRERRVWVLRHLDRLDRE